MKISATLPEAHLQRLILENVSDIIIITDLERRIQSWNHIAENFYGIPAAAAVGRRVNELVALTLSDTTAEEALQTLLAKKIWQGEVSFTAACGEKFLFWQTVKYVTDEAGNEVGIMAVGRNITGCKRAERQPARSEGFYRTLIAESLDVLLLLNHEGDITFASPSIRQLLGYEVAEALGTNGFGYIHPDDSVWARQSFAREVEENPEIKFILVRLRKKSGDWLWCMVRGHNMLNVPPIHSIAVHLHDDTPRKQATDALKESEKRFRKLMQELQTGVLLMDAEGKLVMVNNEAARIFETTDDRMLGRTMPELCADVIHEDGSPFLPAERPTVTALQTRQLVKNVVMGIWNKRQNDRRWLLISADPVEDSEGHLQSVISTFTDITERKQLEKKTTAEKIAHQRQLAQATIDGQEGERLQMGRELHDNIGQQLTSVKLFLELAKSTANAEAMNFIGSALKNVAAVIDEVRVMSRSLVPPTLKDLGFVDSVNDLIECLRTAQPIAFTLDHSGFEEESLPDNKKLALFRIVQEQLNNVVKYARAKNVTIALRSSGEGVALKIADDGVGFDLHKTRRGLGLTNIINRSELFGGRVQIDAAPGRGCTVNAWLPKEEK